jgi:AraC-like DNA-binding protein
VDILSDIVEFVRLKSVVYFRRDFCGAWGMDVAKGPFGQFHLVLRGYCWLGAGWHVTRMDPGDVVLFPHGDPHWVASDREQGRAPDQEVVASHYRDDWMFEGEGEVSTLICGHFEFDRGFEHPLLTSLPSVMRLSSIDASHLSWLEVATNVIAREARTEEPGFQAVMARLAEVLFIQILRVHSLRVDQPDSFLNAMKDAEIGQSLALVHEAPADNWSLAKLAKEVGVSRSKLADRFKRLVGVAPMAYVTNWRMQVARKLLLESNVTVGEVCEKVGYSSEAAFSRAFKRVIGENPGKVKGKRLNH